jgi:hypothetical protein
MAKKATTIVLVLVVVFLLASTVYVSIILTSDTGTTPKQSKASEIDSSLQQASQSALPVELGSAPIDNLPTTAQAQATAEATPNAEPTVDQVAYANPTPIGTDTTSGSETITPTPTGSGVAPTTAVEPTSGEFRVPAETTPTEEPDTSNLPETGLGQPTATPSSAMSPTMMATGSAATTQPLPTELPQAGTAMTVTLAAIAVAGLTIFFAFLF